MRVLIVTVMIALFAGSCQKEEDQSLHEKDSTPGEITGTWELRDSYGGMSPYTSFPPGNGNLLRFDTTTYQIIIGGQVRQQGTYRLTNDSVINVNTCVLEAPASGGANRIVYDNETFLRRGFSVTATTLTLTIGCIPTDGGISHYRRIEDGTEQ